MASEIAHYNRIVQENSDALEGALMELEGGFDRSISMTPRDRLVLTLEEFKPTRLGEQIDSEQTAEEVISLLGGDERLALRIVEALLALAMELIDSARGGAVMSRQIFTERTNQTFSDQGVNEELGNKVFRALLGQH